MEFLNTTVDPATLPKSEEVVWHPIERAYLSVLRFQWLITSIVLLIVAVMIVLFVGPLRDIEGGMIVIGSWLFIILFYLLYLEKSFPIRAYALRDHDILYRHGWIVRKTDVCPFNRIQHCSVHSGPLERNYKLAVLNLYTAASGEGDVKIAGLPESKAQELREFIMKKIAADEGTIH